MQPIIATQLVPTLASHTALLIIIAGSMLLVLTSFIACRHLVSRKLTSMSERIHQHMQRQDRAGTLRILQRAERLLRKWDWLLNESDQCRARQLIDRVSEIYVGQPNV